MKTCAKCGKNFPTLVVIDGKPRNLQGRKYCLECSPFGSHNTKKLNGDKTRHRHRRRETDAVCYLCRKKRRAKGGGGLCVSCLSAIRRFRVKWAAIQYKGGRCRACGLEAKHGNVSVFDFHHAGDDKLFNLSVSKTVSWDVVKAELDKCDLLCSNCHRVEHARNNGPDFITVALDYSGSTLPLEGRRERRSPERLCIGCRGAVSRYSKSGLCSSCWPKQTRKVERPSLETLKAQVEDLGAVATAAIYGVCDSTIRKWIRLGEREVSGHNSAR